MRRHYKPLLLVLLLACSVLVFTSCTNEYLEIKVEEYEAEIAQYKEDVGTLEEELSEYKGFIEYELDPTLLMIDDEYHVSVEEALLLLWCYVEGEETEYVTMEIAQEAYNIIKGHLELTDNELGKLGKYVEDNFAD